MWKGGNMSLQLRTKESSRLDFQDFNIKEKDSPWGDVLTSSGLAIGKLRWDEELPLVSFLHQLQDGNQKEKGGKVLILA
jgi:hypothetical protein